MAMITQASDPTLWGNLSSVYWQGPTGYILFGSVHYTVHQLADGTLGFVAKTNKELYDSRSLSNSKPASYNKLDGS